MAVGYGFGIGAVIAVYAAMALATPLILIISYRYVLMWVTGELAEKTGAARA